MRGHMPQWYDVLEIWRNWADNVRGEGIDCGHHPAEEAPRSVTFGVGSGSSSVGRTHEKAADFLRPIVGIFAERGVTTRDLLIEKWRRRVSRRRAISGKRDGVHLLPGLT